MIRSYTAAEIAHIWRRPIGTVYRLASECGWRRNDDRRRPTLYNADDVEDTMNACPITMSLDAGREERCRLLAPHRIHVSRHGYYRWNDAGQLLHTPHFADPEFDRLYAEHPDGQWGSPDTPERPA